jgi:hypothetical protein
MSQNPQVTLFKYVTGGQEVTFLDDQGLYDAETIRKHWQGTFPELGNCQAETDAKKQTVTVEGQEVEVDRVVTYVKKVGTKGGDADQVGLSQEHAARLREIIKANHGDPARQRLINAAPRMLAALQAVAKAAEAWSACPFCDSYAGFLPAYPERDAQGNIIGHDSDCPWPAVRLALDEAGGQALPEGWRVLYAAPKLLIELRAVRDLLNSLLEAVVFYQGSRQVVIDRVERIERLIAEVSGES